MQPLEPNCSNAMSGWKYWTPFYRIETFCQRYTETSTGGDSPYERGGDARRLA